MKELTVRVPVIRERPITIQQVVEITGYCRGYIYQLIQQQKIPCHKPMGKKGRIFFFESEILDCLSRGKRETDYEIAEKADQILNHRGKR